MLTTKDITARDKWGFDLALKAADLSDCRYRMAAVILGKGGKVLGIGHNMLKTHPQHRNYPSWVVSVHAEAASIIRSRCDIRGATMYIARIGGRNGTSKPCPHCYEYIKLAGIKTIVYQGDTGITKERIV
jgi:deoxycytidylate deaminase